MAQVVSPSSGMEAVGPLLVGSKVGFIQAAQVLSAGSNSSQSSVVQGKVLVARRVVEARMVKVWSMTGRRALAGLRWASSSKKMYSGMSGVPS